MDSLSSLVVRWVVSNDPISVSDIIIVLAGQGHLREIKENYLPDMAKNNIVISEEAVTELVKVNDLFSTTLNFFSLLLN